MELAEYIRIFWKHRQLFTKTVVGFSIAAYAIFLVQPIRYQTEITMNVARSGERATADYAYDDFYRLQADERFADTVVRWLQSPRIVAGIAKEANVSDSIFFQADRLSSQVIRVRYTTRDEASARRIAPTLFDVLNAEAVSLNQDAVTAGWFTLTGEMPSIADGRISWTVLVGSGLFLGLFFGFFATMLKEYVMQWKVRTGHLVSGDKFQA